MRHGGPAVREQVVEGEDRAEHEEHAELHDLDQVLGARLEALADVRPPDPERDRGHEHRDEAVALGREHGRAVRGEGHAERVERLLVRADRCRARCRAASGATRGTPPRGRTRRRRPRPGARTATRRSPPLPAAAAVNASTAGSARPSLRPDSRLSECRMMRGTRGLVTTTEDSTGSVGESSAPSRKHSVQPRSVSVCVATATSTAVSGMASARLRSGRCQSRRSISSSTSSPSRNRIRISATTARPWTNSDVGSRSSTPKPACPSTNPASTKPAVSDRKLRCGEPGDERAEHQQHAERRERRVQELNPRGERQGQAWRREIAKRVYDGLHDQRAVSANWPRRKKISARSRSSCGARSGWRSVARAWKDGCRAGSDGRCSPSSS